jgi:hypothetical protein
MDRMHRAWWSTAAAAACAAALAGCDRPPAQVLEDLRARIFGASAPAAAPIEPGRSPDAPAPATPAATAPVPAAPAPRPDDGVRLALTGERRFAGGRPLPWWSERLAKLRRDGPEALYRLTAARARLAGLEVTEQPGGEVAVAVKAGPRPEARP